MAAGTTSSSASSGTTSSPCGACKFLRRKCATDCVFAPYFCSEQGPSQFAAIHKVFGASNVSKLISHLPLHHRHEAVLTITYEAQSRLRDPVYGCVAHIFALQQQVAYLQTQLMQMKSQIAMNSLRSTTNGTQHLCNLENHNHQWQQQHQTQLMGSNNNNNLSAGMIAATHIQAAVPNNHYSNLVSSPQSSLEFAHHSNNSNNTLHHRQSRGSIQNNYMTSKDDQVNYFQQCVQPACGKKMNRTTLGVSVGGSDGDYDDMDELHEIAFRMMKN